MTITLVVLSSWQSKECDHIYVAVEPTELKDGNWRNTVSPYLTGKQEGKELVCIKCFKRVRQIVEYGIPPDMRYDSASRTWMTLVPYQLSAHLPIRKNNIDTLEKIK